jgi:hypothetical protein
METIWVMIFIWFVLFAGSCLQGTVGFGLGIFAVGWMSLFLYVKDVTLIVLALTVILSSWIVGKLRIYPLEDHSLSTGGYRDRQIGLILVY